jgi:phosphoenolpyruvate carboxylase
MVKHKRKIPSTMVSQHPDHASKPFWHTEEFISTQFETKEAFLSFSELGVSEYKWDWEGKLVDESVMERLLGEYYQYFQKNQLGLDKFLTFRLPNPRVETEFRMGRAFMGLLSAATLAKQVGLHNPPLFEVILPMTETAYDMISIQEAFAEIASLKHPLFRFDNGGLKHIEIIPLFEDVNTQVRAHEILDKYLKMHQAKFGFTPNYMRPYLARSDPALNAGLAPTVLAIKIALSRFKEFEQKKGIKLYPIIGSASLPFRGGLTPLNIEDFASEYSGIKTALLQSAFRYDYKQEDVTKAIVLLEEVLSKGEALSVPRQDEVELIKIIPIFESLYKSSVEDLAEYINKVASYLPKRRERVQHTGLFGYSRGVGKVKLPRAIGFTAALYSLGVPPELIGTGRGIKKIKKLGKLELLEKYYLNIRKDLKRAGAFLNKENLIKLSKKDPVWEKVLEDVKEIENFLGEELIFRTKEERDHSKISSMILEKLLSEGHLTPLIPQAAILRQSLG